MRTIILKPLILLCFFILLGFTMNTYAYNSSKEYCEKEHPNESVCFGFKNDLRGNSNMVLKNCGRENVTLRPGQYIPCFGGSNTFKAIVEYNAKEYTFNLKNKSGVECRRGKCTNW